MSTILLVGRALYFTTVASSVITSVLYPPNSGLTIVTYANAFLSVAFALRAVGLLVVHEPSQLKRLVKVHDDYSSSPVYVWESMPPALSIPRLLWTCDLLLNPRGIGWAHRVEKVCSIRHPPQSRLSFLAKEATKLVIAYFAFDIYRTWFGRNYPQLCAYFQAEEFVRRFLLPPACWLACYGFIDGIRAAIALLAVGGLYLVSPTLAGDPWMYPSIFGSWRYILWPRLKGIYPALYNEKGNALTVVSDIWGKLWHDLCRRALRTPPPLRRVFVGSFSFILSGIVHSAGTYAVIRDAHAVVMLMVFFILLPFFIAAQEAVSTHILERFLPASALTKATIWILAPWFFRYSMIPESLISIPGPLRYSFWHTS
ncbi:hypothetical protein BDW66DRAFT_165135 [Aspergillus desertorum]